MMQLSRLRNANRETKRKGLLFMVHWHALVFLLHSAAEQPRILLLRLPRVKLFPGSPDLAQSRYLPQLHFSRSVCRPLIAFRSGADLDFPQRFILTAAIDQTKLGIKFNDRDLLRNYLAYNGGSVIVLRVNLSRSGQERLACGILFLNKPILSPTAI